VLANFVATAHVDAELRSELRLASGADESQPSERASLVAARSRWLFFVAREAAMARLLLGELVGKAHLFDRRSQPSRGRSS
jgi:hypothetical protein